MQPVKFTWSITLLFCCFGNQMPAQERSDLYGNATREAIVQRLETPISIQAKNLPLKEVVAAISEHLQTTIHLDTTGLQDVGIANDHKVTLQVKNVKAISALHLLLEPLALRLHYRNGKITITSDDQTLEHPLNITYDVSDIVPLTENELGRKVKDFDTVTELILSHVAPDSWPDGNFWRFQVDAEHNTITITQTFEYHYQIEKLFQQLRAKIAHK